jgi:hypothetical protein
VEDNHVEKMLATRRTWQATDFRTPALPGSVSRIVADVRTRSAVNSGSLCLICALEITMFCCKVQKRQEIPLLERYLDTVATVLPDNLHIPTERDIAN